MITYHSTRITTSHLQLLGRSPSSLSNSTKRSSLSKYEYHKGAAPVLNK